MNKEQLFEISLDEFTWALLDFPNGDEMEIVRKGMEELFIDCNLFTPSEYHFDSLEIYDYMEYKTLKWDAKRIEIVIHQMNDIYNHSYLDILEEAMQIIYNYWGKIIPMRKLTIPGNNKEISLPDYKKMMSTLLIFNVQYYETISLLKGKLHQLPANGDKPQRPKEPDTPSGFSKRLVNNDDNETIPKLRKLLVGKKGKDAALIICAAIRKGVITRPTFAEVRNEFGNIGNKSGYNKYMQAKSFNDEEIEPIINAFDSLY